MRLIKMLGLAAVAAIAAMALLGASTASAQAIHLCKKHELPCAAGNVAGAGTVVEAEAVGEPPVLLGKVNEKCKKSTVKGKLTAASGNPLTGVINTVTFTECEPCTTVTVSATEAAPYASEVNMSGAEYTQTVKGTSAKFTGCPLGVTCTFGGNVTLTVLNPNLPELPHMLIHAEEEELTRTGGSEFFCGNTGKWDALYLVINPLEAELELL